MTSECVVQEKKRVHLHLTAALKVLLPPFHGGFQKSRGVTWIQRDSRDVQAAARQAVTSRRPHTSDLLFSGFREYIFMFVVSLPPSSRRWCLFYITTHVLSSSV